MLSTVLRNIFQSVLFSQENLLFLFSIVLAYCFFLFGMYGSREKKVSIPLALMAASGMVSCYWYDDEFNHPVLVYLRIYVVCVIVCMLVKWFVIRFTSNNIQSARSLFWKSIYSMAGAAGLCALAYYWFSVPSVFCLAAWPVLSLLFICLQGKQNAKERKFYTYDDIYQRSKNAKSRSSLSSQTSVKLTFFATRVICYSYLGWRFFFTLPVHGGWIAMVPAVILLFFETLGVVEYVIGFDIVSHQKTYPLPEVSDDSLPDVDVFIATYNEDPKLLYKTIQGAVNMDYPDPQKVHIYVCDDGRREEVEELAKDLGVGYFKRDNNAGAKAGNLNNALKQTSSPYVVTFDADMIPAHNFLLETIPYFADAEKKNKNLPLEEKIELGFIQTPQTFYNPDLFQHNLLSRKHVSNEQDYFYRCIESAKTQSNSVIYGGSNTVLSRKALEDAGGFYTEAITEDFATGLLIQKKAMSLWVCRLRLHPVSIRKIFQALSASGCAGEEVWSIYCIR